MSSIHIATARPPLVRRHSRRDAVNTLRLISRLFALAVSLTMSVAPAAAQARAASEPPEPLAVRASHPLDSLVARALVVNPRLRAARERVRAAEARVTPAGARPDPMLMAGIQNFPLSDPGFSDFMTMKMVGIVQAIPYPGKLALRTRAATRELAAVEADFTATQREIEAAVKGAYYDLAYLDRALEIVNRNRLLLLDVMQITEARYGVGTGEQSDLLRLRVEVARLGEQAVELLEQRQAALASLNALLDRPGETAVPGPVIPSRIARAAVADSTSSIRFASAALGARAADSPIPALATLQATVVRLNPMLRAAAERMEAQVARAELAQKEHLPDFDVSVVYGQRSGFSDMVSAQVSVPIPLQRRRRQQQFVREAGADLAGLAAERADLVNTVLAEVARLHSDVERSRTLLALYVTAILPQGRATLSSATAGYQVGRSDFLALLDSQSTLFNYETTYFRVLSDFASALAELERVVGAEVLP